MGLAMWLPAFVTSGALALFVLAGGYLLKGVIENGLKHGFDRELEKLKAQLKAKETEFELIRSSAISALSSRSTALDQRRLAAAEGLWAATIGLGKYKMAVSFVSAMKVDAILKASAKQDAEGANLRSMGEHLWTVTGLGNIAQNHGSLPRTERLFAPPLAWAAFSALSSICGRSGVILVTMKTGMSPDIFKDSSETTNMIKAVLPYQSDFLDKNPETGMFYLFDQLEEKIFEELVSSFSDPATDKKVVDQALSILKHAAEEPPALPAEVPAKYVAEKVSPTQPA